MDFALSEEEALIRDTARAIAREVIAPRASEVDWTGQFPHDNVKRLAELGFMGMMVPEEFGGAGLSTLAYALAVEEISAACASTGVIMSVNNSLVCHPIQIGDAKSLPFGADAFDIDKGYNAKHLVGDTLKLLKTEESTLVRMETLRRATVYARSDKAAATELLAKLAWKALDAEAGAGEKSAGDGRAAAWFDAGFFAACLGQMNVDLDWNAGVADGVIGYAWIKEALRVSDGNPEMEFAAALATHPGMRDSKRDLFEQHIRLAAAGADSDPLLAKNLKAHLAIWGESLDQIVGKDKDGTRDASRQR